MSTAQIQMDTNKVPIPPLMMEKTKTKTEMENEIKVSCHMYEVFNLWYLCSDYFNYSYTLLPFFVFLINNKQ